MILRIATILFLVSQFFSCSANYEIKPARARSAFHGARSARVGDNFRGRKPAKIRKKVNEKKPVQVASDFHGIKPDKNPDPFKGLSHFRKYDPRPKNRLPLKNKNLELLLGGSVKANYYVVRNAKTLDKTNDDEVNMWRQRVEMSLLARGGREDYGKDAVEALLTMHSALFWRTYQTKRYGTYEGSITNQDSITPSILAFIKEAYLKLSFDTMFEAFSGHPHHLKVGYFPFLVGRGISLGDQSVGGVSYFGFGRSGVQTYAPEFAPGVLWSGVLPHDVGYDLYFSPMVSENVDTYVKHNVLSQDRDNNFATLNPLINSPENANARHVVAGRLRYQTKPSENTRVYGEPYLVYYNSPRQTKEIPCDAPLDLMTLGMMFDGSVGGFRANFEIAAQYGKQKVQPKVYYTSAGAEDFRPVYDIDLRGKMLALDMCYRMERWPVRLSCALSYFSGDKYPYNDTVDYFYAGETDYATVTAARQAPSVDRNKRYTGFLPLRDYDYLGMWTKPLVFMNAGVVPRPAGFSINDLETYNDADTVTNLILLGIGATWYPWKDEHKGSVSVNAFSHWEASQHYKWDTTKTQPSSIVSTLAADGTTSGRRTWSGWYDKTQEAGQHLGYEFSAIFDCEVNKSVSFTSCAGVFFPGQLYRDLSGQPNANTGYWGKKIEDSGSGVMSIVNVDEDAGLGQSISYGAYARVSYEF